MANLHGEIENEKGQKASRLGQRKIYSHISTWDVAIDCWLDKEGKGRCEVSNHKSGEVVGSFDVEYGRVYNIKGEYEMRPKVSELQHESVRDYQKFKHEMRPLDATDEEWYESH